MALDVERTTTDVMNFLSGGGKMGALIRAHDWSATPIGPIADWPQSLRTSVGLMLNSGHAMCLTWGPELTLLYNDAYGPFLQGRHPDALGRPLDEIWSDVWDDIAPLVDRAMAGEAVWIKDFSLVMDRDVGPQETWWTFCYSPLRDERGGVAGMFNVCSESTSKVLEDRRLAAQVERQRRLFEQAPGFVCISNGPEHIYEFVNPAYARLCGARDYLGKTVREVLPELADQGFYELLDTVYATGERHVAENVAVYMERAPSAATEARFVTFVYEPVIGETGEVTGIFVQGHDVTEARVAQEARRVDAEFLRSVLASSNDCIKVLDIDANLIFMSEGALREMEVSDFNAIKGCSWLGFWQGQGNIDAMAAIDVAMAGGSGRFQGQGDTMAGTPKWWDVQLTPILGSDGKPEKLLCVSRDISGQRSADLTLRESEERYRSLFVSIEAGFCIVEMKFDEAERATDYKIVELNPAFEQQTGLQNALGRWISEIGPDLDRLTYDIYGRVALTGEPARFEYHAASFDDRWYDVHAYRVGAPDDHRVALLFNDISERKRAEQALRGNNDTLEQRVAERTAELMQAQEALNQSQKLESMGQLTGGVAHDFNNLLTPIIGSLDMLNRRGLGDARAQRMIDGALQSAERAKTLVQRLLAFARRQPLQPGAVDISRLITNMVGLVESTAGPRIRVKVDMADDLPQVMADPNQLEMALLNLSVNARDAMEDGGNLTIAAVSERLEFGHRSNLKPGDYVRVTVADSGTGMDKATLARAIEPFFSTKGIGKGTGLGLSMVHGLASQLGGALALSSKSGLGTTVELWLPVCAEAAATAQLAAAPLNGATAAGRALLVDDEELVRMSTADMLADLGYDVVEAASAEEALALLDGGLSIDMLVTDHLMPGMTGADLARAVQQRWPGKAVLIVSGYADTDEVASDLPRLNKPFRQADLAASVAALNA